jgi:HEAT repeat protein
MNLLAAALIATLMQAPPAPRVRPEEARLQRIHLRNGDYLEGRVVAETSTAIEIRVLDGLLLLPKHQVSRIEAITLKTHASPPPPVRAAAPGKSAPRLVVLVPTEVVRDIAFRADATLFALRRGTIDRDDALRRLLDCGPEGSLHLASQLEVLEPEIRELVTQSLSIVNNPETLPTLLKLFDSEDPAVRLTAASLAGSIRNRDAGRRMSALLKDRDPAVRAAALIAFEQIDDPAALDWVSPLCADPDPAARAAALDATIKLSQRHEMRETLLLALDRALRWPPKGGEPDILKALGSCGDPEAWEIAAPLLRSPSAKTRAAAATALGLLAAPASAESVAKQMEVELDSEARIQLSFAAEKVAVMAGAPSLIDWLTESDESVRRAALRALRSLSGLTLGEEPELWNDWLKSRKN